MKSFSVTILGSSAAIPTRNRHLTAQVVHYGEQLFLIDCGEGTQLQLRQHKLRMGSINHVFISHLHGDHFFGLIGLISTWHLLRRQTELHIYGPPLLEEIIQLQLSVSQTTLCYPIHFHTTQAEKPEMIFDNDRLAVTTLPLIHRIPTTGFLFAEKPHPRHINRAAIAEYGVPFYMIESIRGGSNFMDDEGVVVANELLTTEPIAPRSFAFCSDTAYNEGLIDLIKGCDLLYHEATFMQSRAEAAAEKGHSTSAEAATIALKAGVGQLLLGHFSARYDDLKPLLKEAEDVFAETKLVEEGASYPVRNNYP